MWQNLFWLLIALAAMLTGVSTNVAAPSSTSGGTAPPAAAAPPDATAVASPLADAISFAPADATQLSFTDWSAIKRFEGAQDISSRSPMEDRIGLLMSTTRGQAAASAFALPYMEQQAALWGWDSTDLLWEATITTAGGPPVYVLRLPDDFDMNGLIARFEERGFARSEQGNALVFTHDLDPAVDWRTELAVFNAVVLPDSHILMHASSPESLRYVLGAQTGTLPSWSDLPALQAVATQLGEVGAAVLAPGPAICTPLGFAALAELFNRNSTPSQEEIDRLQTDLLGDRKIHPYLALGLGYRHDAGRPLGLVVMHYADGDQALADLEPRRALADEGNSLVTGQPYRDGLFTVEDATVEGGDLLLNVRLVGDKPRRLFDMLVRRDMTFAACP